MANGDEKRRRSVASSGSGGEINILTKTLSGFRIKIQANGAGDNTGVGGGGGRVSVRFNIFPWGWIRPVRSLSPPVVSAITATVRMGRFIPYLLQSVAPPGNVGQAEPFRVFLPLIIK